MPTDVVKFRDGKRAKSDGTTFLQYFRTANEAAQRAPQDLRERELFQNDPNNPLAQLSYLRHHDREWAPYLTPQENTVLRFILSWTVCWAKEQRRFTHKFIRYGNPYLGGTGMSETQIKVHLNTLKDKGLLSISELKEHNCLSICVNLEWNPDKSTRTVAGKPANPGAENSTPPSRKTGQPPAGKPATTTEQATEQVSEEKTEQDSRRPSDAGEVLANVNLRKRPTGESPALPLPAKETNPPVAATPLPLPSPAEDRQSLKPDAVERTMHRAYHRCFSESSRTLWVGEDRHALAACLAISWNKAAKAGRLNAPTECHAFADWLVETWPSIRQICEAPEYPDLDFIRHNNEWLQTDFHAYLEKHRKAG